MTDHELDRYWTQANEAERIVYSSGETITGSNLHCEIITGLARSIRNLVDYIRDEKQSQKD